ncbi:hypothetical protein [Exiguobacterium sp. RIT452]|uniref:hypothetical protein n=1 Tax=Exiguobacterium sp. RIT452 TaxID=2315552 RepID=UPI001F32E75F|nr:hypothetical protein [Exiguobacterium sp. RIT452]
MNYISAGYFLVMPTPRKDYMDEKIVPETVLSVSSCLCKQYPDTSILWGNSEVKKARYMDQLGLSLNTVQLFEQWIEEHRNTGDVLFPQVFSSLHSAQDFLNRFLIQHPGIRIISIGLPERYKSDFLEDIELFSSKNPEPYGVEKMLLQHHPPEKDGAKKVGYEVLGFDSGSFHSYLCNGLERDFRQHFNFSPNRFGLIDSIEEADRYSDYCNALGEETESVLWLPWGIFEHKRSK